MRFVHERQLSQIGARAASPRRARARRWLFAVFLLAPLGIMLGKLHILPAPAALETWFSLADIPRHMQGHVEDVMYVPLGAVVVAFFRLALGIRVLSLFRPILVAIAFRFVGIPIGLAFLLLVLGVTVLVRPLLKGAHYYSRVPAQLSIAAICLVLPLVAGRWWHEEWLQRLAYFPVISLCLICEGFAKKLSRRGLAAAIWPTVSTILIGIIISLVARIPGALPLLLRFPELLVAQVGVVLLIGECLRFELLKGKNPLALRHALAGARHEEPLVQRVPRSSRRSRRIEAERRKTDESSSGRESRSRGRDQHLRAAVSGEVRQDGHPECDSVPAPGGA